MGQDGVSMMTPEQWLIVLSLTLVYLTYAAIMVYYYTGNRAGAVERRKKRQSSLIN